MKRTGNKGNNCQLAGWCTDTWTCVSITQPTVTHTICCSFCPGGHGSIPMSCVPAKPSISLLARCVQRSRGNKASSQYGWALSLCSGSDQQGGWKDCLHDTQERKGKWSGLHCPGQFKEIRHSWTVEEILSHSLESRGWNTDHSQHWKQLLSQPIEYPHIIRASFWQSGQGWNSLFWSLIQCESHILKQKWNTRTFNNQPLMYQAYCRYHFWVLLFLKYKTYSYICLQI